MNYLEQVRWRGYPACPYCGSLHNHRKPSLRRKCYDCGSSFSVTVGTIFHHTHLPLQKWFIAVYLVLNARRGIPSLQLARYIGVGKNTAWRMGMQIRKAMEYGEQDLMLAGIVEMDETYVGGRPRWGDGKSHKRGRGTLKTPVIGIVERGGCVVAKMTSHDKLKGIDLRKYVKENVIPEKSVLMTDECSAYNRMSGILPHGTINHSERYVDGDIHTNTIEGFWSILKGSIRGQYYHVSKTHMQAYIHELSFRYNTRNLDDEETFDLTMESAVCMY